jgi:hypothetical protein
VYHRSPDFGEEEEACQRLFVTLVEWRALLEKYHQKPVVLQMVSFATSAAVDAMSVLFNLLAHNNREAVCGLFGIDFGKHFAQFGAQLIGRRFLQYMKDNKDEFLRMGSCMPVWYNQAGDLAADFQVLSKKVQTLRDGFAWIDARIIRARTASGVFGSQPNCETLEGRVQTTIYSAEIWNLIGADGIMRSGQGYDMDSLDGVLDGGGAHSALPDTVVGNELVRSSHCPNYSMTRVHDLCGGGIHIQLVATLSTTKQLVFLYLGFFPAGFGNSGLVLWDDVKKWAKLHQADLPAVAKLQRELMDKMWPDQYGKLDDYRFVRAKREQIIESVERGPEAMKLISARMFPVTEDQKRRAKEEQEAATAEKEAAKEEQRRWQQWEQERAARQRQEGKAQRAQQRQESQLQYELQQQQQLQFQQQQQLQFQQQEERERPQRERERKRERELREQLRLVERELQLREQQEKIEFQQYFDSLIEQRVQERQERARQ